MCECLRFECTGRWPVHFFRKTAAAAAVPDARRGSAGVRCRPRPRRAAVGSAAVARAKRRRFLPGRNDYPLLAVAANSRRCGGPADRPAVERQPRWARPGKISCRPLQQSLAARALRKKKRKSPRPIAERLSDAFVAYVADLMRDPNIGLTLCRCEAEAQPPSPLAALLDAARPVAGRLCPQHGLDAPFLCPAARGAGRSTSIRTTISANCSRSTLSGRGRFRPANSAMSSSTPRSSGYTCSKTAGR